ncbi:3-deoxy-D-manno-octulosonic acid transferase [Luteimonas gilva]|uniref:3-deoxy-D-manno-octulosonic acid transferase n=1 Tax=Luteimonas gilva TaxID=2572684 RepID=A0A4U5JPA9_9GAMM|nr:lipid IV(A) 3-deoxy-D-manno-octulosonic acid transferase [Luteimonas gilva]TKR29677.1 3-deoxy-D-manno-octulosonic acid transferase [Luteimonas gilva]
MRGDPIERILRALYSATLYLLAPVTLYHLIWRGFRHREYFQRWNERYAAYSEKPDGTMVWLHAVSVGEVNAAAPLVDALRRARPDLKLVVTTITPTGSARARSLWLDAVEHVYLPYDLPGAVGRFLDHFRPRIALILETELWPNLLFGCRDRDIPSYVLNARLSERSLRGYRVLAPLIGRALRSVTRVAAQSAADGERFVALGAQRERVVVTGNLKYDIAVPADVSGFLAEFQASLGAPRPVWIAASTHDGEEAAVIAAHRCLRKRWPDLLLLWAPRHPERFRPVADLARGEGLPVALRSQQRWPQAKDAVFVVDTLGELTKFYGCADVAFVGGSLQPIGGHNLLEPAALGKAIVTGPHLHNFAEIAAKLEQAGALRIVAGTEALASAIETLLADPAARTAMGDAGLALVAQGRGALARTMALIEPQLPAAVSVAE